MNQIELEKALKLVKETSAKHPGADIKYSDGTVRAVFEYHLPGYEDDYSF